MSRGWKGILLGFPVGFAGLIESPLRFTLGMEESIGIGLHSFGNVLPLRGGALLPLLVVPSKIVFILMG